MPKERVAIVKVEEQRLDEALQRVVEWLGPLETLIPPGSRVVVKPNYTIVPTDQGVTHPELVEALVRLASAAAASQIVIAESSGDYYTSYCYRFMGIDRIAARYGARVVDLNVDEGLATPVPEGLGRDHVMVPRTVVESDVLISLPVFKLWGASPMSLSLKNLFGLYGARYYGHNKNSAEISKEHPFFARPGEVGTELGIHQPSVAQSVCAINAAVPTHLAIVDALEGGDGAGNWIRLDTLIAGRNPVAVDTVGMALSGFVASEYPTFALCAEKGLGPCALEDIQVLGCSIEEASFQLERLRDNVLEMPLPFCLNLLSTGELLQMQRGVQLYELWPQDTPLAVGRAALLTQLAEVVGADGYYEAALAKLDEHDLALLELIVAQGGTSGDLRAIRQALSARYGGGDSLHYAPPARALQRLGLAYPVEGLARPYFLLPQGLAAAFQAFQG